MTEVKQIINTKRFFIHKDGYCFKVYRGREYILPLKVKNGVHKVLIENEKLSLVKLMLEYFYDDYNENTLVASYKVNEGKVPIKNMVIKDLSKYNEDEKLLHKWKCSKKASSANNRVSNRQKISSIDVLDSLKRTDFKCTYCNTALKHNKWHLDHAYPLSRGGINVSNNITPSCRECNIMKSNLPIDHFLSQCNKIVENYNKK